jgi:RNA polymerase sigma factor (sigma-70 family)
MTDFGQLERSTVDDLLMRVRPRAQRILRRYRIPAEAADDLVQEAMLRTLAEWDRVKDPEAWILVTLRNRCVVYWRKQRNELYNAVDQSILELLAEPAAPSDREELKFDLQNILEELPPRCRELLKLRYGLGYDTAEVAEAMGYHASSVRKVARRCMAALTYSMLTQGFLRERVPEDSREDDG